MCVNVSGIQSIGLSSTRATASMSHGATATQSTSVDASGGQISNSYRSSVMLHSTDSSMATGGLERAVGMALAMRILEMLLGQSEDDQDSGMQDMMMLGMLGQLAGQGRSAGTSLFFEREVTSSHTFSTPAQVTATYESSSVSMVSGHVDMSA